MIRDLVKRFREIKNQEGLGSALQSTQAFILNKADISTRCSNSWRRIRLWKLRLFSNGQGWSMTREINGSKMKLDINPSSPNKIERTLALEGIREPGATKVFQNVLTKLKNQTNGTIHVFDVGSNVGYFALPESRILGEQGRIYAIEAEPNNTFRLNHNIKLNNYSNIEVLQIALGAERAQMELAQRPSSNVHMMKDIVGDKQTVGTVDVEVYPLDALIAEREIPEDELIIIRMDIEGYEGRAFEGMSELLTSDRPVYIFTEIHPKRAGVDPNHIANILIQNGFYPEYVSFDGGETCQIMNSMDELRKVQSNTHIMTSRL